MMKYLNVFEEMEGVKAFFTTKAGAVEGSPGGTIFDREEIFAEVGLADGFRIWPKQVHGTETAVIREEDLDVIHREDNSAKGIVIPETDGAITNVPGVVLTSVHADCLPVYLYDRRRKAIGLVHAGWRGAVSGIVPQAMRKMTAFFGTSPDDLYAFIGPGISKCCFEVGSEVAREFLLEWGNSYSESNANAEEGEEKYMLDLKGAVKDQLLNMGVSESHIEVSNHCTCCEPELFCSYRREGGTYMRMGAGIALL